MIKKALMEEVEKRTKEELKRKVERASRIISKAGRNNWVRAVRETRDQGMNQYLFDSPAIITLVGISKMDELLEG